MFAYFLQLILAISTLLCSRRTLFWRPQTWQNWHAGQIHSSYWSVVGCSQSSKQNSWNGSQHMLQ